MMKRIKTAQRKDVEQKKAEQAQVKIETKKVTWEEILKNKESPLRKALVEIMKEEMDGSAEH